MSKIFFASAKLHNSVDGGLIKVIVGDVTRIIEGVKIQQV
jgi:hypothetical protein